MNVQPEPVCGRSADDVRADVADGREDLDHLATCASCRAVADEARQAWAPLVLLSRQPVAAPAGLTRAVLHRVRTARPGASYLVAAAGPGSTRVSGRVLARVAGRSAAAVPGVAGAVAREVPGGGHGAPAGGATGDVAPVVEVAMATQYGVDLRGLAARVRRHVQADLSAVTGLHDVRVDVVVDDVRDG